MKRALPAVLGVLIASGVATTVLAPSAEATDRTFHTVGSSVNLRDEATSNSAVATTVPKKGSAVTVDCYSRGQSVNGDTIWYYATYGGRIGFVAGYWLDTGHDPNPTVSACGF